MDIKCHRESCTMPYCSMNANLLWECKLVTHHTTPYYGWSGQLVIVNFTTSSEPERQYNSSLLY